MKTSRCEPEHMKPAIARVNPSLQLFFSRQTVGDYEQFSGHQGEVRPGHTDLVKHYQSSGHVDAAGDDPATDQPSQT